MYKIETTLPYQQNAQIMADIPVELVQVIFSFIPIQTRAVSRAAHAWADKAIAQGLRIFIPRSYCHMHMVAYGFNLNPDDLQARDKLAAYARGYHIHRAQTPGLESERAAWSRADQIVYSEMYSDYSISRIKVAGELLGSGKRFANMYILDTTNYAIYIHDKYMGVYEVQTGIYYRARVNNSPGCGYGYESKHMLRPMPTKSADCAGEIDPHCVSGVCGHYIYESMRAVNGAEVVDKFPDINMRINQLHNWIVNSWTTARK